MCYLTLVDTILDFENLNWCIIHILEISSLASQNWLQDPRPQHMNVGRNFRYSKLTYLFNEIIDIKVMKCTSKENSNCWNIIKKSNIEQPTSINVYIWCKKIIWVTLELNLFQQFIYSSLKE